MILGRINCDIYPVGRDKMAGRKLGAALISKNISQHILTSLGDKPGNWRPLIYCWRGGQRSRSLAIILRQIGYEAHVLMVCATQCDVTWLKLFIVRVDTRSTGHWCVMRSRESKVPRWRPSNLYFSVGTLATVNPEFWRL